MVKIDWHNPRKYLWPVNAVLFYWDSIIAKRDKRIWIFGAWRGRKYDDNTRYLFEYVNKFHKEVRAIWFTKTEQNREKVQNLGYEVYCFDDEEAREIQKKAGVVIYTHGLSDFGFSPRVGGAFIVSLWHGMAFKRIYNDKYFGWQLAVKKMLDRVFSWTYRDITMVTSEYTKQQFSSIFGLSAKDVICITGQPRNDIFHLSLQKQDVLKKSGIDYTKNIVLYMPTYRGAAMGPNAMDYIVKRLYENTELDNALTQTNSIFVVKTHPLTPHINLTNRNNFIVLDYYMVENNQELLAVSDILISDYSSCIVDYALLERPVIFYLPDHKAFITQSEPLYEEFMDLCESEYCTTAEQLANKIINPDKTVVNAINELFEDKAIKGSCYTENVYNAIIKYLN